MTLITIAMLCQIAPGARGNADAIVAALNAAMTRFAITNRLRICHFLAQLAHESNSFTAKRENLNYQPHAILATFGKRFTPEQAELYGRTPAHAANQQMIANIAYANRMGNGDVASGDGWKNRGAGWIQLTGAANLRACAEFFDIHPDEVADWLCTPAGAAMGAGWFWTTNHLNEHADHDDVDAVSDIVNLGHCTPKVGDAIGYNDRLMLTQLFKGVIA